MDRALILLHLLRLKAFFRRWGKNLRSVKGILFSLVGLMVFVPWIISLFIAPRQAFSLDPVMARRFGPMALLAYAMLATILSTGERALFFTPAEIAFLFPGPFSRKALLRYKIIGIVFGCAFSSAFMTLALGRANRHPLSAYLAITLSILFFQMMAMAIGLAAQTLGVMTRTVRQRAVLGLLVVILVGTISSLGRSFLELPPEEMLAKLEASPVLHVVSAPLRPFVELYCADHLWPDLIGWASVCVAITGVMTLLVFATDASYLENAAATSEKLYQQILRAQKGGTVGAKPVKTRFKVPMLPWLGGAGPILWRQFSSAVRQPFRLLLVCTVIAFPAFMIGPTPGGGGGAIFFALGFALWLTVFLTPMITYDFRGDVDRMEELKTFPTPPIAMVLGQVITPFIIFSIPVIISVVYIAIRLGDVKSEHLAAFAMSLPATFLLVGIENLLFLLFPSRLTSATPADFAAFGRQIFLMFAKALGLILTLGASALMGTAAYFLLGASRGVAFLVAFGFACGFASLLIPLMAWAFLRYDVARDTPA